MATRVTQIAVEALDQSTVLNARVTQIAVEVLDQSSATNVRVTQVAVEVLFSLVVPAGAVGMPTFRRLLAARRQVLVP